MKIIRLLAASIFMLTVLASCEKETKIEQIHTDLEMMDVWQEFELGADEEIIFKVTISNETRIDLAWKDLTAQKEGEDSYTGDVIVSAYRPDGFTPYFEDADMGYKDDSKMLEIVEGDTQVIIIVSLKDSQAGTFALRTRGYNDDLVVTNPKDLDLGTTWVEKNCNAGDVKWLKVDCGSSTDIAVEWQEFDRPEIGSPYTADVKISVFSEELDVTYVDAKDHGYDDKARTFTLTHSSSIIYIMVSLNDDTKEGSYAIRAYPQTTK